MQWKPPGKKEQGGRDPTGHSPRNKTACHSMSTALSQSVAKIGTQSTMKSSRKTVARVLAAHPLKRKLNPLELFK
jgi:hypothetical protein